MKWWNKVKVISGTIALRWQDFCFLLLMLLLFCFSCKKKKTMEISRKLCLAWRKLIGRICFSLFHHSSSTEAEWWEIQSKQNLLFFTVFGSTLKTHKIVNQLRLFQNKQPKQCQPCLIFGRETIQRSYGYRPD